MVNSQLPTIQFISPCLHGDVWLCQDSYHDNQLVAVKQISLERAKAALSVNPNIDNPFNEQRIIRRLSALEAQEHILRVHREFLQNGSWFVVMDYCAGGDLMRQVEAAPANRLTVRDALGFFFQVAQGVRFLHDNDIAHRDLSLENVLLANNSCKICDFGLAVDTNRVCTERVGKAYYMAPEVVAEQAYDPKAADMWSLGIILFILLTGSPLVASASREEKAFLAVIEFGVQKILEVWGIASSISPVSMDLLSNLLQVSPAKRLTATEVLTHEAFHRP